MDYLQITYEQKFLGKNVVANVTYG